MSAALEGILEVLKQEAEVQVRTEYENEVRRLRAALDETAAELERTLADLDNAVLQRDKVSEELGRVRRDIKKALGL